MSMMMDVIWKNHDYSCKGSCNILLDEKSNIDVAKFFELLKDYNKPLGAYLTQIIGHYIDMDLRMIIVILIRVW